MKAIEIKKDLKQSGFNTQGISIRIDNAYSDTYILVTIPDEYAGNKEELTSYLRNKYDNVDYYIDGTCIPGGNTSVLFY